MGRGFVPGFSPLGAAIQPMPCSTLSQVLVPFNARCSVVAEYVCARFMGLSVLASVAGLFAYGALSPGRRLRQSVQVTRFAGLSSRVRRLRYLRRSTVLCASRAESLASASSAQAATDRCACFVRRLLAQPCCRKTVLYLDSRSCRVGRRVPLGGHAYLPSSLAGVGLRLVSRADSPGSRPFVGSSASGGRYAGAWLSALPRPEERLPVRAYGVPRLRTEGYSFQDYLSCTALSPSAGRIGLRRSPRSCSEAGCRTSAGRSYAPLSFVAASRSAVPRTPAQRLAWTG